MRSLALLALLFGCGAVEEEPSTDESSIQGGHADEDDPAVGLIWFQGGGFCSGVLISPSVVLTAGHCVAATPIEGFYTGVGKKTVVLAPNPTGGLLRHAVVDQVAHPSYSPWGGCPNQTFDVGLARLAKPIKGVRPLARAARLPSAGSVCRIVGYGIHNSDAAHATVEQKRTASVSVEDSGTTWLSVDKKSGISDHGDSGGPLLCSQKVAGVTSCGTDGSYPDHRSSYYARTDNLGEWIDATIQRWK